MVRVSQLLVLVAALLAAGVVAPPAVAQDGPGDGFLAALADANRPVDRRDLAGLCFASAAALESGRASTRMLGLSSNLAPPVREEGAANLEARFDGYARAQAGFSRSVAALVNTPGSDALLFRALQSGQRACWQLDLYERMLETYGAGGSRALVVMMPSLEACARFRTAAFHPRVEALVAAALARESELQREVEELEEELEELERLVDDLVAIDAEVP